MWNRLHCKPMKNWTLDMEARRRHISPEVSVACILCLYTIRDKVTKSCQSHNQHQAGQPPQRRERSFLLIGEKFSTAWPFPSPRAPVTLWPSPVTSIIAGSTG